MKSRSDALRIFLLAFFCAATAVASDGLFGIVPQGDPAYRALDRLSAAGLIAKDAAVPPLTRYDAAQLVLQARGNLDRMVLAQASTDKPKLPSEMGDEFRNQSSGPSAAAAPQAVSGEDLGTLSRTLNSLEEAYQSEIKILRDKVKALEEGASSLESGQKRLLDKAGKGQDSKRIALHGLGRAIGASRRNFGFSGSSLEERTSRAFLDLEPEGVVSKEVSWNGNLRLATDLRPDAGQVLTFRRMTVSFRPKSLGVTMGDFEESFTPLVMWNRDLLDMAYAPESWSRLGDQYKYESLLNHEPAWPLRGLKAEFGLDNPGSQGKEGFKVSALAHMVRNGLDDTTSGGWYFGPKVTTDWLFGGTALLKLGEMRLGGKTIRPDIESYGLMLDQPLNGMEPGSPYDPLDPSTWVHRYLVGSVKPVLKVDLGSGRSAGGSFEYAYARYQDDLRNAERVVGDFAVLGEVYAKTARSKVSFQYLSVGPHYYSPMAQTRQDAVTQTSVATSPIPDAVMSALRGPFFMATSPRAGYLFTFYDRTRDAVFPYGLATPNRQGFGLTADLRTLKAGSLRFKGSAYLLEEIEGNLVLNATQTGFVAVEEPTGTGQIPVRDFTYVNVGPSINLGPYVGFKRELTVGANLRLERTASCLGVLTGISKVGSIKAEVLKDWEVSAAYSLQTAVGDEAWYGETLWARTPTLFDNTDLNAYRIHRVDGQVDGVSVSTVVKTDNNSRICLDAGLFRGDMLSSGPSAQDWKAQFVEMTYEVQF